MEQNRIQKPLIIEMEDAKIEIAQVLNNAIQNRNLPLYIIDMILSEFIIQIKEGARKELEMAKGQMQTNTSTSSKDGE